MTEQRIDFDGLRMVGRAVEAAPEEQVDMTRWCGTTQCAIGWFCSANPADELKIISRIPSLNGRINVLDSLTARFGLTVDQAGHLFGMCCEFGGDGHKGQWLARLAQFIADHEPKPSVEVKADAAFMRSLDPIALRNAEDDAGAAMVDSDCDGMG